MFFEPPAALKKWKCAFCETYLLVTMDIVTIALEVEILNAHGWSRDQSGAVRCPVCSKLT